MIQLSLYQKTADVNVLESRNVNFTDQLMNLHKNIHFNSNQEWTHIHGQHRAQDKVRKQTSKNTTQKIKNMCNTEPIENQQKLNKLEVNPGAREG